MIPLGTVKNRIFRAKREAERINAEEIFIRKHSDLSDYGIREQKNR
jgi:hypothetical protein